MLKKHLSGGLAQHNQCHSYKGMYEHRHAVYGVKFACTAAPAYLIRQIALHGYGHRTIDKSKQGHLQVRAVRFKRVWNTRVFRNLFSFAVWSALGEMAWAGTGQGVNILLNIFFSPVVNAARAIAVQVIAGLNQFVMSFQTAVNPQIIKSYAAGDKGRMMMLANKGVTYSYYLLMLLGVPAMLNMDYILRLWLKTPPDYCAAFCNLAIVGAMADCLSNLLATVAKAYGRIRNYQLAVSAVLFLNLQGIRLQVGATIIVVYPRNGGSLYFFHLAINSFTLSLTIARSLWVMPTA